MFPFWVILCFLQIVFGVAHYIKVIYTNTQLDVIMYS